MTTAEFIKHTERRAAQYRIKALATDDPVKRKEYEQRALAQQIIAERLQKIYSNGVITSDRKF